MLATCRPARRARAACLALAALLPLWTFAQTDAPPTLTAPAQATPVGTEPAAAPAAAEPFAPVAAPAPASVPATPAVTTSMSPPPAAEPAAPRRLFLTFSAGYDHGFNQVVTETSGFLDTSGLGANGGFFLSVGGAWAFTASGLWELRFGIGAKYDWASGTSGNAYYHAFPVELLVARRISPIRVGAGLSLSLAPGLRGGGLPGGDSIALRSSLGLLGEVDWIFAGGSGGTAWSVGLRGLLQRLQPADGGKSIDANALGLVFGATL